MNAPSPYRAGLPEMPASIRRLPVDERGYPVPWFVEWIDGKPDFRIMDSRKFLRAMTEHRCWICGETIPGRFRSFVIGPMCSINRISAEPPSHRECAVFAVKACPFLTLPKAIRREANRPAEAVPAAGIMLEHNPGAMLLWIAPRHKIMRVPNGYLFSLGEPAVTQWWTQGRHATRAEAVEAFERGLSILRTQAEQAGQDAMQEIELAQRAARAYLPK